MAAMLCTPCQLTPAAHSRHDGSKVHWWQDYTAMFPTAMYGVHVPYLDCCRQLCRHVLLFPRGFVLPSLNVNKMLVSLQYYLMRVAGIPPGQYNTAWPGRILS